MIVKEIYIADDGKRFDDKKKCLDYDDLCKRTELIVSQLNRNNAGHEEFVKQDAHVFYKVRKELLDEMGKKIDHRWIQESIDDETVHPSWVSRILGEYGLSCLDKAWYRISCTDKEFKEWDQPYFANKADDKLSNKELTND